MAFSENKSVFFSLDTPGGVLVSFSGSEAGLVGIMDKPGTLELSSITGFQQGAQLHGVQSSDKTVLLDADKIGSLVPGSSITVDGVTTTVRYLQAHEDGQATLVFYK